MKGGTKSLDVAKQKTIFALNQALVPLIRALNHIAGNKSPDVMMLKNYIGDIVKLMCGEVHKINMQRWDTIKKERFPKFITLCSEDQPVSATGLFGDDLANKSKSLDTSKSVQMTPKGKNVLFKRVGGENGRCQTGISVPPLQPTDLAIKKQKEVLWTKLQGLRQSLQQTKHTPKEVPRIISPYVSIGSKMFKLKNTVHNFEAGKTGLYSEEWEKLTNIR